MELMVMGVAAVGCTLVLEACGGSAGYNPAAATSPSTNSPLRLSQCMHSHGIKSFPDPTAAPGGGTGLSLATSPGSETVIADGIMFSGPAFDAAAKACAKLLPGGGAAGNAGSQRPAGVDPSSPAFKQAVSACGGGRNGGFQVPG